MKIKILGNGEPDQKAVGRGPPIQQVGRGKNHGARRLREAAWRARLAQDGPRKPAKGIVLSCLRKILLVFRIPELRRKILLTIDSSGRLPARVPRLSAVHRPGGAPLGAEREDAENQGRAVSTRSCRRSRCSRPLSSTRSSAWGLPPYITASIIFQLLGTVYPPLEALQKEGEAGQPQDQRIHAIRNRAGLRHPELRLDPGRDEEAGGSMIRPEYDTWFHQLCRHDDNDRRCCLSDVDRRTDRRVRHR